MIFWIIAGALTAAAAAALLWPMTRRKGGLADPADYDIAVYKDQLAELERETARGALPAEEAEAARTEIARRILAADTARASGSSRLRVSPNRGAATPLAIAAILLGLPFGALGLYSLLGSPDLPGQPFAERAAQRHATEDLATLATRLADRLEREPKDLDSWLLLARTYAQLGRHADAAAAYQRALGLDAGNAEITSAYGEALFLAAGGVMTEAARAAFEATLQHSPGDPRARYYLALARYQAGEREAALEDWTALIRESPADAPWMPLLRQRVAEAARALGRDVAQVMPEPLPPAGSPGNAKERPSEDPSAADMAAAQAMSPEERQAMIEGMVERLAARLEKNPEDFDGWMRLGRAYMVLEQPTEARDAFAQAADLAPKETEPLVMQARALRSLAGNRPTEESLALMRRVLALDPNSLEALWFVGHAEAAEGNLEKAKDYLDRALAQLPPAERETLRQRALKALGEAKAD